MADGSGLIVRGKVLNVRGPNGPKLCEVGAGQVIVGCCNACGVVGEVDRGLWRFSHELAMYVSTVARQLRCVACAYKSVSLQLWPVAPYPEARRPAFQRWR